MKKEIKLPEGATNIEIDVKNNVVIAAYEPKEVKWVVECRNREELMFWDRPNYFGTIFDKITYPIYVRMETISFHSTEEAKKADCQILQFHNYLKQKGLQKEWGEYVLPIAKEKYPKGTRLISIHNRKPLVVNDIPRILSASEIDVGATDINGKYNLYTPYLLYNGKWAEIIPELFTAEDNIKWYEDSGDYWMVNRKDLCMKKIHTSDYHKIANGLVLRYSTEKAAKEFVKKEKERREKKIEKPIDKVTIENLDIALRMVGIEIHEDILDKVIDLVELIEEKGDLSNIKDIAELQMEWNKNRD